MVTTMQNRLHSTRYHMLLGFWKHVAISYHCHLSAVSPCMDYQFYNMVTLHWLCNVYSSLIWGDTYIVYWFYQLIKHYFYIDFLCFSGWEKLLWQWPWLLCKLRLDLMEHLREFVKAKILRLNMHQIKLGVLYHMLSMCLKLLQLVIFLGKNIIVSNYVSILSQYWLLTHPFYWQISCTTCLIDYYKEFVLILLLKMH